MVASMLRTFAKYYDKELTLNITVNGLVQTELRIRAIGQLT
jgi:hypothetical protein